MSFHRYYAPDKSADFGMGDPRNIKAMRPAVKDMTPSMIRKHELQTYLDKTHQEHIAA
jgi:hypothetical protein